MIEQLKKGNKKKNKNKKKPKMETNIKSKVGLAILCVDLTCI